MLHGELVNNLSSVLIDAPVIYLSSLNHFLNIYNITYGKMKTRLSSRDESKCICL